MTLERNTLVLLAAGGSAALLIGAFIFQALGYAPCQLCLWQRYPHAAAVAIGVLALWRPGPALPLLGALAALSTAALGIYHSGIERKWWEGFSSCTSSGVEGLSPDELMQRILEAPLVRCDEIAWQMFGITMPNLNAAFSLAIAVLWLMAARRSRG